METSTHSTQYTALQSLHSDIRLQMEAVTTQIHSFSSVESSTEYQRKARELRASFSQLDSNLEKYERIVTRLRRQVSQMLADNTEKKNAKEKEEQTLNEFLDSEVEEIECNEVILRTMVTSIESKINHILTSTITLIKSLETLTTTRDSTVVPELNQPTTLSVNVSTVESTPTAHPAHDSTQCHPHQSKDDVSVQSEVSMTNTELFNLLRPARQVPLTPFDGVSTTWESFHHQYLSIVDAEPISEIHKLLALREGLKGEALTSVQGIPIVNGNLKVTLDRLTTLFGRSSRSESIIMGQLRSIKPKSQSLESQLECTQTLINMIFQLPDRSKVDNTLLINDVACVIHHSYLDVMHKRNPSTMMEALSIIEMDLLDRIDLSKLKSTYSNQGLDTHSSSKQKVSHAEIPVKPFTPKNAHRASSHNGPPPCVYCDKHSFSDCTTITSISERKSILKEKKLCFKCLSSTHMFKECTRKCQICGKPHHKTICDSQSTVDRSKSSTISASVVSDTPVTAVARLFTTSACLQNPVTNQSANRCIMLDSGSMISVISRSLAEELNLKPHKTQSMSISGVGGNSTGGTTHDEVTLNIVTTKGLHPIKALVMDTVITRSMHLQPLSPEDYSVVQSHCGNVVQFTQSSIVSPDMLLSVAQTQNLLRDSITTVLPSGYNLVQSILGPMITGESNSHPSVGILAAQNLSVLATVITDSPFEAKVERHFSLDETAREYSTTEAEARLELNQRVENHFHDTVQKIGDEYQVQYFLKPEVGHLPTNEEIAFSRLKSTVNSQSKNLDHFRFYDSILKDQLAAGMIEPVDTSSPTDHQCHYLAHQAVLRPDKPTTPLRIVFDASAKFKGKPCLNDVIAQGPCTLEHIPSLLIRSRSRKTLIVSDVEKAFLQVRVHPSQRDLLRFFWLKDINKPLSKENLLTYRFTVTPFGVNQSPYLLSKVIETHLKSSISSDNGHLISQLIDNIYVDNVIINTDNPSHNHYSTPKSLFRQMGMNLRDFASNSNDFIHTVPDADQAPIGTQKLLGIIWNPSNDQLSIRIPPLIRHKSETKRTMLSTIASIYDPMGWLLPLILLAKVLVQKLWCLDLKWDQPVDHSIQTQFHTHLSDIESFHLNIPRYTGMSSCSDIHLVAFADASQISMGAMIYLWTPTGISLLMSRTRLAPAKSKATIPKLELNALVMAHSMLIYVVESIRKEFPDSSIHTYVYSDSAITLFWYLNDPDKKSNGIFVTNRVKSIRQMTDKLSSIQNVHYIPARYVKTDCNPADLITRGLTSTEMNNPDHMWWKGAPWMVNSPDQWPDDPIPPTGHPPYTHIAEILSSPLMDLERCSTLNKAINVTGFVLRFIQRSLSNSSNVHLKEKFSGKLTSTPILSASERSRALTTLIRNHQSCHIHTHESWIKNGLISRDENDIWRANSRLDNASIFSSESKKPILIPTNKCSTFARLLIGDTHISMFHAGTENVLNQLKQKYWIPRGRQLVKSTIRSCIPCRKTNNLPYAYTATPPLPSDRVSITRPFQSTGIDFVGPFTSKVNVKMYAVIFTCLSSRLSHIEVTESLLPSAFINAVRRFTSRRGTPSNVLSDQGTTLKLSSTLLKGYNSEELLNTLFQPEPIQWKFTTSHAPWKGAVYERLIRIFKDCLSRSIGKRKLSFDEFSTITSEIEAVLNTRPLTYVASDEINSFTNPVIRPVDLIMPHSNLAIQIHSTSPDSDRDYLPPGEENMSRSNAIRQLSKTIEIIDSFWSKWHNEYLTTLRDSKKELDPLHSYRSSSISPKPGAIVLIIDESGNTPRSTWHMGRILSIKGSEATLKSDTGRSIQRPINLLIPLELDSIDEPSRIDPGIERDIPHPMTTRSKSRR